MTLQLSLHRNNEQPLYRQISDQIRQRIADGSLPAGTQLPTVRGLAQELGVTRITAHSAYAELQSAGWVEATVGRGTFVSDAVRVLSAVPHHDHPLTADVVIDDMIHIGRLVGVRSMANASPDPRLYPAEDFWSSLAELRPELSALGEYGAIQGDPELRIELASLMRERGLAVMPGEVLVTNGATQALSLVTQALCRVGDTVLVETPTYLSFLNILQAQGVQAAGVPMDDEGPDPDALERLVVQLRPRFLYTIPVFHNPTGVTQSAERRRRILDIAERHGLLIVEDDLYARVAYGAAAPPSLKSMDPADLVIYVSSMSKILMPGLRMGYVTAPENLFRRLVDLKRATDLCSPSLIQRALAEYLRRNGLKRHLKKVLPEYQDRRDALLTSLAANMPPGVGWTRPNGGYCCWITLPKEHAFDDLYPAALRQGWAFAPGNVFLPPGAPYGPALRICFGQQPPFTIRAGVEALAQLIRTRMESTPKSSRELAEWSPIV